MNRRTRWLQGLCVAAALVAPCARPGRLGAQLRNPTFACCRAEVLASGLRIAERYRVAEIPERRFTHDVFWRAVDRSVNSRALRTEQVGASLLGRPIRSVTFGRGPTRVLLWSQMHGDESTATMALADLLHWFADPASADDSLHRHIASALTVIMVPMLNPDGAELFQRENAIGVDVNRDARRLSTPEARALQTLRDSIRPAFGFNLHDQNARTLVGAGGKQVAIALLAPAADEAGSYGPVRSAARLLAAEIATVLAGEIPGRVARYDDAFEPRAFGDLTQKSGASTVLIESGALPGDPEKQALRTVNVVAILSALDAIAAGRVRAADARTYDALPTNARAAADLLVRGASLVLPGVEPMRVDIALNYDEPVAKLRPRVREVGDLQSLVALDTIDAPGLFLHPAESMLTQRGGMRWLRLGAPAALTIRRGPDAASEIVRTIGEPPAGGNR